MKREGRRSVVCGRRSGRERGKDVEKNGQSVFVAEEL